MGPIYMQNNTWYTWYNTVRRLIFRQPMYTRGTRGAIMHTTS